MTPGPLPDVPVEPRFSPEETLPPLLPEEGAQGPLAEVTGDREASDRKLMSRRFGQCFSLLSTRSRR